MENETKPQNYLCPTCGFLKSQNLECTDYFHKPSPPPIQSIEEAAEKDLQKVHIEEICVIAKMADGNYHHLRTKKSDRKTILQFLASISDSGAIELVEPPMEGIEF